MEDNILTIEELREKVKFELGMIKIREVQIEDMKLRIEDMELGNTLKAVTYNDMPVGSKKCNNNDNNMYQIDKLKKTIKRYEIGNKRIDNALKILSKEELEIIQLVCIYKMSVNKTSINLGRKRATINKIRDKALDKMANFYK